MLKKFANDYGSDDAAVASDEGSKLDLDIDEKVLIIQVVAILLMLLFLLLGIATKAIMMMGAIFMIVEAVGLKTMIMPLIVLIMVHIVKSIMATRILIMILT
jgi:hypothetical protein